MSITHSVRRSGSNFGFDARRRRRTKSLLNVVLHIGLADDSGLLIGLSDPRLARAMDAMHKHPEMSWSLEELAQAAGMSRARFAAHFRNVVGTTPFDYLTDWRMAVAQTMLREGRSLKLIAPAVGYANSTALTRVFTQRLGMAPTEWLARSRKNSD